MSRNSMLLSIRDLTVTFQTDEGTFRAVDRVGFDIYRGRTTALVGESGCGKSVTALSILRLIPSPPGKITSGRILFESRDLLRLGEKRMRAIRGNEIAMIFQEPMTSLNPVYTIGDQIAEVIEQHQQMKHPAALSLAAEMLRQAGIADPQRRIHDYPHQLSGGMRQRVMIAMALSCDPALLIADEPTTALDVTIQAQILDLMKMLQRRNQMSVLLITHDLAVVAENADDVVVMYASKIVEKSDATTIFHRPAHPYTQGLLHSLPKLNSNRERLDVIPGYVPDPLHFPSGCKFHPRCRLYQPESDSRCRCKEPPLEEVEPGHAVACWKAWDILHEMV